MFGIHCSASPPCIALIGDRNGGVAHHVTGATPALECLGWEHFPHPDPAWWQVTDDSIIIGLNTDELCTFEVKETICHCLGYRGVVSWSCFHSVPWLQSRTEGDDNN